MPNVVRTLTRLRDMDDLASAPGAGETGKALLWNNGAGSFAWATPLLADGSVPLTGDWDIGGGRKVLGDTFAARSASGLRLQDSGGNLGIFVANGGKVGIFNNEPTAFCHIGPTTTFTGATPLLGLSGNGAILMAFANLTDGIEATYGVGTTGVSFGARTAHPLVFLTNNTDRGRIDANGNFAFGTTTAVTRVHVQASVDALSGVGSLANYHMLVRYPVSTNGIGAGIAFGVSGVTADVGASIIHERTGGNNQGNLRFYVKTSTTSGAAPTLAMILDQSANAGINTASPTARLDVNGDTIRLRTSRTPASAGAAGNAGDICWDSNYLYVCIATNTWRRIAHATW